MKERERLVEPGAAGCEARGMWTAVHVTQDEAPGAAGGTGVALSGLGEGATGFE